MKCVITILAIFIFCLSHAFADDLQEVRQELNSFKVKLRSAEGSQKVKLMKKMAKLENELVESSGADRNKSKTNR